MSINPANLPTEFVHAIARQRFRTLCCVECMNNGVESPVEYYYGHLHHSEYGVVITGHCVKHISVIAKNSEIPEDGECEHGFFGCSGLWRSEYGLERLTY